MLSLALTLALAGAPDVPQFWTPRLGNGCGLVARTRTVVRQVVTSIPLPMTPANIANPPKMAPVRNAIRNGPGCTVLSAARRLAFWR